MLTAGLKYIVKVSRRGPQSFRVFLGSSHVEVVARKLNDGGLLVQASHLLLVFRAWYLFNFERTLQSTLTNKAVHTSKWGPQHEDCEVPYEGSALCRVMRNK